MSWITRGDNLNLRWPIFTVDGEDVALSAGYPGAGCPGWAWEHRSVAPVCQPQLITLLAAKEEGTTDMDWRMRLPAGMQSQSQSGNQIRAGVELPLNADELFGLRCRQVANHRFAMKVDPSVGVGQSSSVYCPYCGRQSVIKNFFPPETWRWLQDAAKAMAEQYVAQAFSDMLGNAVRGSRHVSFTPGRPPAIRRLSTYTPEPTRRTMTCGSCSENYAVFGIALSRRGDLCPASTAVGSSSLPHHP